MKRLDHRIPLSATLAVAAGVVLQASALAATPQAPACTLSGTGHVQICPVAFNAYVGRLARVVVARYSDFSHCSFAPEEAFPGNNANYVVGSVTISWGDGTHSKGVAVTGKGCPGPFSPVYATPGENEPVTGLHRYRRRGNYVVSVSITYLRGAGNTYQNCATQTPGDPVYNELTNCIALGAPAKSVGIVRKRR